MKRFIFIQLACLALAISCSERKEMDIFPEHYKTIIYIKESSTEYVTIDATAADRTLDFTVCKAGSDIGTRVHAELTPLLQSELDENFNAGGASVRYMMLPEDTYTMDTPLVLDFSESETYKVIACTLNSEKLAQLSSSNPGTRYVLGFRLSSESTSVNEKCATYMCEISDVIVPTIGFERAGLNRVSAAIDETWPGDKMEISIPVEVKSLDNRWDIDAKVIIDEEYLKTYNAVNLTDYALPADGYEASTSVSLHSTEQKAYVKVSVGGISKLLRPVMIPLRLTDASQFKVSESDGICAILIDPTIKYPVEFDRTEWKWQECCHEPWENSGNCSAYYMIDNDINSYWHYSWEASSPCKGQENHCFVFDMGRTETITGFGYIGRQNMWSGNALNALSFFVSDDPAVWGQSVHDHTNWTKIVDAASVDNGNAEQSIPSRLFRGRYLKVMIAGSNGKEGNNGVMKGCIAEIKVYGKSN